MIQFASSKGVFFETHAADKNMKFRQEAQFMDSYTAPLTPEQQSHNKQSITAMVLGIVSLVVT